VIENRICEGTDCLQAALSSGMTSLQVVAGCKKCGLGEQWSSDFAVSCTLAKHSDIQSENTSFEVLLFTPLTWISIDAAHSYLHPLLFLRSPVDCVRLSIMHILGFITANFLTLCFMIMLALAIFQEWILMEVIIGKSLTYIWSRHMGGLFAFYCECTVVKRKFKNIICVTSVFFAFTVYFANNPLSEFSHVHLKLVVLADILHILSVC
jgi:hypothetical protein